jgi:hypothetical protein
VSSGTYQSTKACKLHRHDCGTCPLSVSAQCDFFRRLVLCCYLCRVLLHYGACLHGLLLYYIAFGFLPSIMIKPTFGFGERNTDGGGARSRLQVRSVCIQLLLFLRVLPTLFVGNYSSWCAFEGEQDYSMSSKTLSPID